MCFQDNFKKVKKLFLLGDSMKENCKEVLVNILNNLDDVLVSSTSLQKPLKQSLLAILMHHL